MATELGCLPESWDSRVSTCMQMLISAVLRGKFCGFLLVLTWKPALLSNNCHTINQTGLLKAFWKPKGFLKASPKTVFPLWVQAVNPRFAQNHTSLKPHMKAPCFPLRCLPVGLRHCDTTHQQHLDKHNSFFYADVSMWQYATRQSRKAACEQAVLL